MGRQQLFLSLSAANFSNAQGFPNFSVKWFFLSPLCDQISVNNGVFQNVFISSARKRQNQDTIARTSNWNGNNRRKRPGVTKLKQENETTQLLRITSSATSEGQQCFSLTLMMEHEKTVLTTSCAFVLALLWQSCQQRTFLHSEIYSQSFSVPATGNSLANFCSKRDGARQLLLNACTILFTLILNEFVEFKCGATRTPSIWLKMTNAGRNVQNSELTVTLSFYLNEYTHDKYLV